MSYVNSPLPHGAGQATGKQLLRASWAMLKQDRELIWLPVISALSAILAAAILFVPGFAVGWLVGGAKNNSAAYWIGVILASFGASVVSIYFQAALVIAANERAEGRNPTRAGVLALARQRRGRILRWAVVTTTVGTLLRLIQDKLGAAGGLVSALGGMAWAIATFLAVPVLVAEDLGPVETVKRSSGLLKHTWGSSLRVTLRFGIVQLLLFLPILAVLVVGFILVVSGADALIVLGAVLLVAAVVALIALGAVFSAIGSYARALIYRYANGLPTPGVNSDIIAGAFVVKR